MFSRIFIDRPRLAMVISIIITLAGLISLTRIPVAKFPSILPPQVRVRAYYPGADAETVAKTVAAPIEKEMNGVDNMLYMESTSSNDGSYMLTITFAVGTDPDIDQVNVQNRVQLALPRLPDEVVAQGLDIRKRSLNMLAILIFYSPKGTRSKIYLSNYIDRYVKDDLVRLKGISDAYIYGERRYSMRIWLDPRRLTAMNLTPQDVIAAIRSQNIQAALGSLGAEPIGKEQQLQITLRTKGRLKSADEFKRIVIRTNASGGVVRVGDVARVKLEGESYITSSFLNGRPSIGMALYRATGANAMDAMKEVREELKRLSKHFPRDVDYKIIMDSTRYIRASIHEIILTLFLTAFLVILVIYVFLQNWRATLIPSAAVPVSIIGTFAVLLAMGMSANTISLFALVLAIGLVVDDAIVVVENVHRLMEEEGLQAREATIKSMEQVTGPIVATTLVLLAVFMPIAFVPGISGQLYRQFAVTICVSVIISAICALTLSPALCATLFTSEIHLHQRGPFALFNKFLSLSRRGYVAVAGWLLRKLIILGVMFLLVVGSSFLLFRSIPRSFLPLEDQGYFFIDFQLPEGASQARTMEVLKKIGAEMKKMEGIEDVITVSGYSIFSGIAPNVGFGLANLKDWDQRKRPDLHLQALVRKTQIKLMALPYVNAFAFSPPAILGLGTTGGFDFRLEAREGQSPRELAAAARALVVAANRDPRLTRVFTTFRADTPQFYVNLDRTKAEYFGVPVSRVFSTLQAYLGSAYVNDFNLFQRTYQVKVQAQAPFRNDLSDIRHLYVRNNQGKMVLLSSVASISTVLGPKVVHRYNQFPSVQINGQAAPGHSSGEAMAIMEKLAARVLPSGFGYEWSSSSFQQKKSRGQVQILFILALVFAYLFLVGQYESWVLPLPIILYIPVAALGALLGLWVTGLSFSIYAQIGLVMLVGLASKNAILMVEFSRDRHREGLSIEEAALEGARTRFRPVLMTAFTFILGVAPLVIATGAGAMSRRHIGTTVFSGMLVATTLGILLVPGLYYVLQSLGERKWTIPRTKRKRDNEGD